MITLAIESATESVGVALAGEDGIVASVEVHEGRRHAEVLAPAIEFVCRHAQLDMSSIAAIGVDVGPGLFTGMRVGIATAKAMAQALQVPVAGLCSLDVLAAAAPDAGEDAVVASVVDARKGEVFYALHRRGAQGSMVRVLEPALGSIDDVAVALAARGQHAVAVGNGAWRYRDQLRGDVEVAEPRHPSPVTLALLARALLLSAADAATAVDPMYLRAPDAEINWSRR